MALRSAMRSQLAARASSAIVGLSAATESSSQEKPSGTHAILTRLCRVCIPPPLPAEGLFSISVHRAHLKGAKAEEVRELLPSIDPRRHVSFDPTIPEFGPLREFVIDTDENCTEAVIMCSRSLVDGQIATLFEGTTKPSCKGTTKYTPTRIAWPSSAAWPTACQRFLRRGYGPRIRLRMR